MRWSMDVCNNLAQSPENYVEWKNLIPEGCIPYDSWFLLCYSLFFFFFLQFYWEGIHIPCISPKCTNQCFFLIYPQFCNHHYNLMWEHFHHAQRETLYVLAVTPNYHPACPNLRQPLVYLLSLYVCLIWAFLIKWNHTTCLFDWLLHSACSLGSFLLWKVSVLQVFIAIAECGG